MPDGPPFPLVTLAPTIDENGVKTVSFASIFASLQAAYRQIYGLDVNLAADTQDGQWIAVQAQIMSDLGQALQAAYFSYSPSFASGVALSNLVKINGLLRKTPTNSTVPVRIVGQVGTTIAAGTLRDANGNLWDLEPNLVIPLSGELVTTATSRTPGHITTGANTAWQIVNPVPGWQTASNADPAQPGAPLETDAALRARQRLSTSIVAITPAGSIRAAVLSVPGVTRAKVYDNDTDGCDENGIPPHSISVVVQGGTIEDVGNMIGWKNNVGAGTWGDVHWIVEDGIAFPLPVNFFYLELIEVYVTVYVRPRVLFQDSTVDYIKQAIPHMINRIDIGETLYASWLQSPAALRGDDALEATGLTPAALDRISFTYVVDAIMLGKDPVNQLYTELAVDFTQAVDCIPDNVTVIVGPGGTDLRCRATVSATPPDNPGPGNLWWDTVSAKLFIWDGSQWIVVVNTP